MSPGIFTWSESLNASQQRDSGRLLDVHPLQVCLPFEENKLISWPLHLANNSEDEHVAFRCTPKTSELYFNWLSQLCGILPPKSSCTYVVTMERQQQPPANMDALDLFLDCGLVPKGTELSDVNHYTILSDIEESEIDDVVITVCHPADDTVTSEQPIRPRIKILWSVDSEFVTMDVHPTEPWVLAGHYSGYVSMWNYETPQARMLLLKIAKGRRDEPCRSIRFIARMEWFVAGDVDGFIHVYACMTNKGLKKFKAHKAWVMSLSIHPSHPFLLASSDDHLIKLWNWENDWSCIRTFESHSNRVEQVMFNPRDGKTFASVSLDGTVKIWSTFSHVPIATFDSFPDKLLCVDYFSPDGDRQYLVTGSTNGMARIWDLETEACIRQLRGLRCDWGCNVGVIDYLPSLPILITASPDNVVSFHNTITYRSVKTFNFMLGRVNAGFAYIKSIRR
uniref:Uncharacterized protein n=1 Tax=Avena sativa TaxID=4498 RepID=A0ACD5WMM8_AVESA